MKLLKEIFNLSTACAQVTESARIDVI